MERSGLLGDLAIFARVVSAGGISPAAAQLGMAKSSLSARVAALEEQVGTPLLLRSRGGVRPTQSGEQLILAGRALIAQAEAALAEVRGGANRLAGTLRITCVVGVADVILVPLLAGFLKQHEGLSVDVLATDVIVDPRREGVDVAFRFGWLRRPEQGFIARRIGTYEGALVAAPDYIALAGGPPRDAAELAQHSWIGSPAFGGMRQALRLHGPDGRAHELQMTCRIRTTAPTQQREWAIAGLGITRLPRFLVAADLAAGRLVQVLPDHRYEGPSLFAVYSREAAASARVKALLAYLRAHAPQPTG
ncbi:LysR family transcriptional regulator [Falsiroseomonas sp. E2-1-a4]|uniref:LysR family transcriptional regulator n=1 Tax=Falsiroseomonas sp. E2-1-a4 TaxID=3239299 RepID=UPI003F40AC44